MHGYSKYTRTGKTYKMAWCCTSVHRYQVVNLWVVKLCVCPSLSRKPRAQRAAVAQRSHSGMAYAAEVATHCPSLRISAIAASVRRDAAARRTVERRGLVLPSMRELCLRQAFAYCLQPRRKNGYAPISSLVHAKRIRLASCLRQYLVGITRRRRTAARPPVPC